MPFESFWGRTVIIEEFLKALATLLTFSHLAYLSFGVMLGFTVGILPGLGGVAGLSLLLPFVWGMEPSLALAMMLGLQSVTATSDTFPSILMGIPGTASSQATVMDGFPMSKRGEATRALSAAFTASILGGLFGAAVLTGAVFVAEPIIMAIGFGEQMMLIVLALTMIGMLTGTHPLKGLASCAIGLMIGAMGAAPSTGVVRLAFGTEYLIEPLKIVVMGVALFAMPEIVDLLRRGKSISKSGTVGKGGTLQGIKDVFNNLGLSLRCSAIGCLVGALPGLGGSVVDWIAYGHAVQTTKNPERYGTGDIRGVIAPESANNAKEGGALIPTILFGIPGSGSMAVLLGGFFLIGIDPGVELLTEQLDLVYLMIWSVAVANIIGAGACMGFARHIAKLTTIRYTLLAPFMIGLIFFAAFQATCHWGDLISLMILGIVAIYMKRFGWPRPAVLIGFVLSDQVEASFYQTAVVYGFSVLQRPIVLVLLAIITFSIYAAIRFKPNAPDMADPIHAPEHKRPQIIFLGLLAIFPVALFFDTFQSDYLTALFPVFASLLAIVLMIPLLLQQIRTRQPATCFYDSLQDTSEIDDESKSIEHYMAWILGMLAVSALFGFVIGIGSFIYAFIRVNARLSHLASAGCAVAFIAFLGLFAKLLVLKYPLGLLQEFVQLPWPLQ